MFTCMVCISSSFQNAWKAKCEAEAHRQSVASMYKAEGNENKRKWLYECSDDATDNVESNRLLRAWLCHKINFSWYINRSRNFVFTYWLGMSTEEAGKVTDHQMMHLILQNRIQLQFYHSYHNHWLNTKNTLFLTLLMTKI